MDFVLLHHATDLLSVLSIRPCLWFCLYAAIHVHIFRRHKTDPAAQLSCILASPDHEQTRIDLPYHTLTVHLIIGHKMRNFQR